MAMRRLIVACVAGAPLAFSCAASAAETGGCESFAWPLATELSWMKAADKATANSGDKIAALPDKAVTLALQPMDKVAFPVPSTSRKKETGGQRYGGFVEIDGATTGSYQVTISAPGWIDVVQNGKSLKPTAHTGKSDCDGVRKSVRFDVQPGPFVVELSGVATGSITFAVRHAP